jgi:hypothetical protein
MSMANLALGESQNWHEKFGYLDQSHRLSCFGKNASYKDTIQSRRVERDEGPWATVYLES